MTDLGILALVVAQGAAWLLHTRLKAHVADVDRRVSRIEKNRLQWRIRVERRRKPAPRPCREVGIVNGRRICADD